MTTATENDALSKYQKMTDVEHVLKKPDTYIGSIQPCETIDFIAVSNPTATAAAATLDAVSMVRKPITYIPGLYKLFDEGIVNMRDHVVRQAQAVADGKPDALPVSCLEITCSAADGTICMTNDGNGIDVAQHPEHKLWIPEMIFGHLRTSTNYDENKKEKIVGGKNGFGFKLVLIWSTWGSIETVDHVRGLKYYQEFHSNLATISPPKITKCTKTKPYTKVSFRPDYARFGVSSNVPTADMMALFMKRAFDIAAVTDRSIRVKYNGETVPVKHFQQYVDLYIGGKGEAKRAYESPDSRWEYVVCLTHTDEFAHVSFVNGIYTPKGGKHVEYILGQIVRKLAALIKKKKKVDVKPATIKEQLMLFLRCDIENPSFSSQTKDELGTNVGSFGSSCTVSDEFVEKIAKMGVMDAACALTEVKDTKAAKKTDGVKSRTVRGIPKLMDANFAGTDKSAQCTIIFCEGDSAKAGIVSGLSKDDRNFIGVYPMKGKMFNVRGEAVKRIAENHEIAEIKQIMGLETGREYTPELVASKLRYGKILFMTDQDLDGSHIKGLGINLFQSEWASLAHIPGFIGFMNTPILKATRHGGNGGQQGQQGQQEQTTRLFYNDGEYEEWKRTLAPAPEDQDTILLKSWNIKYYKGLGTSTSKEFKEYFEQKKVVSFVHGGVECDNAIDMAFNKKRADDRKTWLTAYSRETFLDTRQPEVSYSDFIDREMIHFSVYDNERSIPNLMDGQKLGQRKILYAAFKKGLTRHEIKVAQFSGYVSEHSGYHHGEASLNATIVGMAQNYVGSNNINLFEPNGQFGCIDPETPVLLWTGEIAKAKNIKVGDKLVGDDGECRIVSKLTDGVDEMYEVSNGNMDNYIVNSHHILTVSYSKHKSVFWKRSAWYMYYFDDATKTVKTARTRVVKPALPTNSSDCFENDRLAARAEMSEFSNTIPDVDTFDINVQQYLALPASVKVHVKGVVNTSVIQWNEQALSIDPYTFGLCLGDGTGMVEDNKHVPIEYVVNSEENRLNLLAGMIDTDGCLRKHNDDYRYTISQCEQRKHVLESFRIVAGSLGFRAKILKSTDNGMFELSIMGDNIHKIPVKVPRKQIGYPTSLRNKCGVHKIEIKSIGRGAFCGWNIDKNERFLLGDFTITHNTRLQGGKDSASERYIFTMLNPLTRLLFRPEDDGIMKYLNDDGELVEPVFYAPIIPMILVNGTKGIGTGFSTDIMCYNPLQIIAYMKALLTSENGSTGEVDAVGGLAINPYYHGFKGTISATTTTATTATTIDSAAPGPTKYVIKGVYSVIDDHRVRVSELPVGYWTEDFKTHLESLMETPPQTQSGAAPSAATALPFVKEYCDMSTDSVVDFTITLTRPINESDRCSAGPTECNALEKMLKLHTTQTTSNMNLFDEREQLHKYDTVYEIARAFFRVRRGIYEQRKQTMLTKLRNDLSVLSNRARYIQEQLDDTLDLRRQKRDALLAILKTKTYVEHDGGYDYLLKMPMDGVTDEKVAALLHERDAKQRDYTDLVQTSAAELWMRDLDTLERAYSALLERQRVSADLSLVAASKSGAGGNIAGIKVKKTVMVKRKPAAHNVDNA
jgi:DNA gyrase/topoisomerase IV subunit B